MDEEQTNWTEVNSYWNLCALQLGLTFLPCFCLQRLHKAISWLSQALARPCACSPRQMSCHLCFQSAPQLSAGLASSCCSPHGSLLFFPTYFEIEMLTKAYNFMFKMSILCLLVFKTVTYCFRVTKSQIQANKDNLNCGICTFKLRLILDLFLAPICTLREL